MDETAHRLTVIALCSSKNHAVSGPADDLQIISGEPFAKGFHVTGDSGLTDTKHLTVIEQFPGFAVPKQFKEKVPAPFIPGSRLRTAVLFDLAAEFLDILQLTGDDNALALTVHQAQTVFFNITLQEAEFPLYRPFTDSQMIGNLLLGNRTLSAQQYFQNLLCSRGKIHIYCPFFCQYVSSPIHPQLCTVLLCYRSSRPVKGVTM